MARKSKLGLLDYLQRGVGYSCVGLSVYAVVMSIFIHRDTMQKGEGEESHYYTSDTQVT